MERGRSEFHQFFGLYLFQRIPYVYHFLSFQPTKRNLKSSNSFKESIFKKKKKRWCRGEWWWSDEYIFDGIFWKNLNTEGTLEEPKNQTWMNIIALPLN